MNALKRNTCYGLVLVLMLLFIVLPLPASGLCIRLHFSEITNPAGFLYYTTRENPNISEDQKITGVYNEDRKEVSFWIDGIHAGELSALRLDFANDSQLIGIDGVSFSSAGVIKKQYNPVKMFGDRGVVQKNDIEALDLLTASKQVYILTAENDPYLLFSPDVLNAVNGSFSRYRLSRFLICLFLGIMYILYQCKLFSGRTIRELRLNAVAAEHKENHDFYFAALLSMVLGALMYKIVLAESQQLLADFNGHLRVYLPLFYSEEWWKGWMAVPYCMWHLVTIFFHSVVMLPLDVAGAYSTIFFVLMNYFVLYWILKKTTNATGVKCSGIKSAVIAFGLSVLQGLSAGWIDTANRYLGIYSMNPLHNPTQLCVKPFALLCFCLVYDIFERQSDTEYHGVFFPVEKSLKKHYIYLAILLFLSTLAKPTFAQTFIPAVGLLMLTEWIKLLWKKDQTAKTYFAECLKMLLCAVPSLLYIGVSYTAFFIMGGSIAATDGICLTSIGRVWSMFTENIFLSIALGMAFPLLLLLMDIRSFIRDSFGRIALTSYLVGLLEALFLGESGEKLSHGNFIWPMISGMTLLWTFAMIKLLCLEQEGNNKKSGIWTIAAWGLFAAHILCGFYYIQTLIP